MSKSDTLLSLQNIRKTYPIAGKRTIILDDVSLDVSPGEWVGLMGASGSGKTTLLSLIAGLTRPNKGKIYWKKRKMLYFFDIYPAYLRNRHFGFIFQDYRLIENKSTWENMLLPLRIRGWYGKKELHHAQHLLEAIGLVDHKNHKAGLLSGGQKQRLSIARALVLKPSLLLADEPLANIDEKTAEDILDLLVALQKNHPFAMIFVHHRKKLTKYMQRTYQIKEGRLHEV